MVMSWIFTVLVGVSVCCAIVTGKMPELAAAVPQGAQAGVTLVISMAGSVCLWTGIGKLMEKAGLTGILSKLLGPLLRRLFPASSKDTELEGALTANICANILGLGNAATPMGMLAAQRLTRYAPEGVASNELCRLVVLNTASIQLIPATVAAVRSSLGSSTPFDILPAVWITSICSAGAGLTAAWLFGRLWKT